MDYTTEDFVNVLLLRNQLVNVELSELMKFYEDYDRFCTFLRSVLVLRDVDSAFLLFRPEFIEKIERVIQIHRFGEKRSEVWGDINEIVLYLNQIKSYSDDFREMLKEDYRTYQQDCRKTPFEDENEFLYSMAYDAVVYCAIQRNDMDFITEDDMYLVSINYFIETFPEMFQDPAIQQRVLEKIAGIEVKGWPFRKELRNYSKETREAFQKLKQKEE